MNRALKIYFRFTLWMLLIALFLGVLASFSYLFPESLNRFLPFYQLRPMHVSAALFWILSGATAGILFYKKQVFKIKSENDFFERGFILLWMLTIGGIFIFYAFKKFGGREYWEFPPVFCIPVLTAWIFLTKSFFTGRQGRAKPSPLYVWMWTTGVVFFLITFLEQNLYQIPWFRQSFLKEITIQWKSNGAMVGSWNQMIYGTSLFVMVKLLGDESIARSKQAFFFYFLGLTNLMFNWGHHIYNVPGAGWVRHVSYAISMTEWIIFINIIQNFKAKISEQRKFRHLLSYRFLIASEYWIFSNLTLALFMSIPAVNRYTHGTHITVAHAMGTTIGINTMILLSSLGYILKIDYLPQRNKDLIKKAMGVFQILLAAFWLSLVFAGVYTAYQESIPGNTYYSGIMMPVNKILYPFAVSGIGLFLTMSILVRQFFKALKIHFPKEQNLPGKTPEKAPVMSELKNVSSKEKSSPV